MYVSKECVQPLAGRRISKIESKSNWESSEKNGSCPDHSQKQNESKSRSIKAASWQSAEQKVSKLVIMQIARSKRNSKLAGSCEVKHHVLAVIRREAISARLETDKAWFGIHCS